jgi:hypothetical protein
MSLPIELLRIGITTLFYFACIWGWGALMCRRLLASEEPLPDFIAARMVMGCLSLYVAFILMAWLGYLRTIPVATVCATGLLLMLLDVPAIRGKARTVRHWIAQRPGRELVLLAVVCFLAVLQIACAFTPLIFYDSQVYHLLAPVQFLHAGYLVHIPWNVLTNSPQALQLTLGMSWSVDESGSTFKLLMALLGCLSMFAAGRIGGEIGIRSGIVSALFVAAYPEFWTYQTLGVVDFAVASFAVFGAIWWMESLRRHDWNRTILAGAALGFVLASRYQGVVLVTWIVIGVTAAECLRDRKIMAESIRRASAVGGIAILMTVPWLLRNYSAFGNPIFPFMQGVTDGAEWSMAQAVHLQSEVMGPNLTALSLPQILVAPINALLIFPGNGLFGLALLIGSLMAVYSKRFNALRPYAVVGIGGLAIWGVIHPAVRVEVIRFNSGSLVLLLACTGALLARDRDGKPGGMRVALTLAVGSAIIAIISLNSIIPVFSTLVSGKRRTEIRQANVPSWQALGFTNEKLDPVHHKVLLIGEARAVWLRVPFIAPSAFNGHQLVDLFGANVSSDVWTERLRRLGITHILICSSEWQRLADTAGYFRLDDDHLKLFLGWLHTLPVLFDDHRGNVVLSLVETAGKTKRS